MKSNHKAFTLIELLVVIAIIAILAAILFPVFAQAKSAAKKAADLSNVKQMGTAMQIYLADSDDLFPQTAVTYGAYAYPEVLARIPADWMGEPADIVNFYNCFWANSLMPYTKSAAILESPSFKEWKGTASYYTRAVKTRYKSSYVMNGLLGSYSGTAVASPSQLIAFGAMFGNQKLDGYAGSFPGLYCDAPVSSGPCVYVPSKPTCSTSKNGEDSSTFILPTGYSYWTFGNGTNVGMADTSAKFRRIGGNINGKTDYRTDWMTRYNAQGYTIREWQDTNFCHTLAYMPDSDFQNFGTPIEY